MSFGRDALHLGGRALLAGFLLQNAFNHYHNTKMMAGYAKSKNIRAPRAAVVGSGALLALGGLSLLTGYRPRTGIAATAAFFIGVTPLMHAFWKVEDENQRMNETINFSKNIALLGATAAMVAVPQPWPLSVDRVIQRRRTDDRVLEGSAVQHKERRVQSVPGLTPT